MGSIGLPLTHNTCRLCGSVGVSVEHETPASAMSVLLLIMALTLSEVFVICMCKLMAVYAEYAFYSRFSSMEDLALMAGVLDHPGRNQRSRTKRLQMDREKEIKSALSTYHYSCITQDRVRVAEIPDPESCPVCLISFHDGIISMSRICKHKFHEHCITEWLKKHDTCPLCRQDVFASDEKTIQFGSHEEQELLSDINSTDRDPLSLRRDPNPSMSLFRSGLAFESESLAISS